MKTKPSISGEGLPNYIKYFYVLGGMVLTGYILILSESIFKPIMAALIFGLLLKPFSSILEKTKMPRALSSILSILTIFILLAGLSMFFSSQLQNIASDLDSIADKFNELIDQAYSWTEVQFGIKQQNQTAYLRDSLKEILQNSSAFFSSTISATAGFFSGFFLFLLALFFFLYYRSFLVSFLYKVFRPENHLRLKGTLLDVESVVRSYILGLFLVITIVAILNTVGLMILGIEHAIFFGVLAALLTVIPYVGILIGAILPAVFALVTHDSLWYPLGVMLIFWLVQFVEGNFITPNIIGNQVSINPFAAILGLFVSGMMFGALGMVFALPVLAIIKVICDNIPSTAPVGYLIGNPPKPKDVKQHRKIRFPGLFKSKKPVEAEVEMEDEADTVPKGD